MLTRFIFDWAQRSPDKHALVFNGRPYSYRAFADLIARARGYFVKRGVGGEGVAVVAAHNLVSFWVISLALRSLGLTTIYPPSAEAIAALGLPDVRCVATSPVEAWPGLDGVCAAHGWPLLPVSLDGGGSLDLDAPPATRRPGGHILRTSGTTGNYKKVLMDPSFEEAFLRSRCEGRGVTQDSVVNVFDYHAGSGGGYKSAACTWLVGGTVVIHQAPEPHRSLLHPGLTHACTIPPILAAILSAPEGAFPRNDAMQIDITAGTVTQAQIVQAKARITNRIYNIVGSTEASNTTCTLLEKPEDLRWHQLVPGRGVEIVDAFDQPTPMGQVGRLRVSTAGGPTGYFHDEEATRAFFKDGFFYPGDLAVIRSDGRMALEGRVTDVINMRGLKISPAPIEETLKEALGVVGVCLFSMQNDDGEEVIHVIIEGEALIPAEKLTSLLRRELGGFGRAQVHHVRALPRNDMGKMLRQAARALVLSP